MFLLILLKSFKNSYKSISPVNMSPEAQDAGAHSHVKNTPNKLECLTLTSHSSLEWCNTSLFGPVVSYKENEVCEYGPRFLQIYVTNYLCKNLRRIDSCDLYYESFTVIIYDNGLYYITTIVANLAFARSVNYDRKVRCKLKCTFTIINYDRKHL